MIGLDTNVLLRWLIDDSMIVDDAPQQSALVSQRISDGREVTYANIVVVAETLWVVAGPLKQPKSVQAEIVSRLLSSHNVEVANRDAIRNALEGFMIGQGGFIDHLIGELNALAGCSTTLTFDKAASKSKHFTALV